MADELRIGVSAPGAKETEQQLKKVAGAEKAVGGAAGDAGRGVGKAAGAKRDAAQATRELDDRNRTLAERFRALGPEAALVGDAIDALTLKEGKAAAAVGVLGVAILGATMIYQQYAKSQAKQAEEAKRLIELLKEQRQGYLEIAEAIEEVNRAASARGAPAPAPAAIVRQVAGVAPYLGTKGIGEAAEAVAAAGGAPDDQTVAAFADWLQMGGADRIDASDPAVKWKAFRAQDSADSRARWAALRRAAEQRAPSVYRQSRGEGRLAFLGMQPAARERAEYEAAVQRLADEMSLTSGGTTVDQARDRLVELIMATRGMRFRIPPEQAKRELAEIYRQHPGLDVGYEQTFSIFGRELQPVFDRHMTIINQTGVIHNGQYADPAGVPIPAQAP